MSKRTDRTLNAANSVTIDIPNRMAEVLAAVIRSLTNLFSFKATLIFCIFCSASASARTRQCPSIWLWVNLWFGKLPIEMIDFSHITQIYSVAIRFVNFFNELLPNYEQQKLFFLTRNFTFDIWCACCTFYIFHIFGILRYVSHFRHDHHV